MLGFDAIAHLALGQLPSAGGIVVLVAAGITFCIDQLVYQSKAGGSRSGQGWSGAGYMGVYEIDTTIELTGVFINALTGVYIDPTTVQLYVLDPTGVQTSYTWPSSSIVRDQLGHFHQTITPNKSGTWLYKWQGSGAAVATSPDTPFTVNQSALIPG